MIRPAPCPDCGNEPVIHFAEMSLAAFDRLFGLMLRPAIAMLRPPARLLARVQNDPLSKLWLLLLGRMGAGTWHDSFDDHDALRTRALFESAVPRGIRLRQFRLFGQPHMSFLLAEKDGRTLVFEAMPRPSFLVSKNLDWIDDKGRLKRKFIKAGFPVPKGGVAFSERHALKIFRSLRPPVIAKPTVGSGSRHTTIHITDEEALCAAFRSAKRLSPWVVIEEELFGDVYRATVVDGRVIGVVRRDPARVVGDGLHTIRELVAAENLHPLRQGPIFSHIATGPEADHELSRQNFAWESIPSRGRIVTLSQKINWHLGGVTEEVTETVHPENILLFEKIAAFVNDPLIGIDFIIEDITRPWQEQERSGVIELNSMPFIDNHHYLFAGEPRDAAGAVWDTAFPGEERRK